MPKIVLHRHTLATSLFLLSTFSPCAGTTQKSQQNIDGQKLLEAIQDIDDDEDGRKAKAKTIALLNKTPTPNLDIKDDEYGATALQWAVGEGLTKIVALLLQKGANKNIKDKEGKTPLQRAKEVQKKIDNDSDNDNDDIKQEKDNLQTIIQLLEADNQDTNLFNQKNIFIGIAILIIVAGLGYLFWPEPQDEDTPRHTKAKSQQEQSTKATRTATAK